MHTARKSLNFWSCPSRYNFISIVFAALVLGWLAAMKDTKNLRVRFLAFLLVTWILCCMVHIVIPGSSARWFDFSMCCVCTIVVLGIVLDLQDWLLISTFVLICMQKDWSYILPVFFVVTPFLLQAHKKGMPIIFCALIPGVLALLTFNYFFPYLDDLYWSQLSSTFRGVIALLLMCSI